MPNIIETRLYGVAPELRSADGQPNHIVGYGAVFGKKSRKLPGGFFETVDSRAFDNSKSAGYPDVLARFDHRSDALLGTTAGGTLQLSTDDNGLFYDVVPPAHMGWVVDLMKRGDVKSSSFAFRNVEGGDDWGIGPAGIPLRTLLDCELIDVAPVVQPAYPAAPAFVRDMAGGAVDSLARKFSADPEEIRSLLGNGQAARLFKPSTQKTIIDTGKANVEARNKNRALLAQLQMKKHDPYLFDDITSPVADILASDDAAAIRAAVRREQIEFETQQRVKGIQRGSTVHMGGKILRGEEAE